MHAHARVRNWRIAALVALIALVAAVAPGGFDADAKRRRRKRKPKPPVACATLPEIRVAQPLNAPDILDVARIAGSSTSDPDEWEMVYDAWWCNPTSSTYEISTVNVEHLDAQSGVIRTRSIVPAGDKVVTPGPAEPGVVHVRDVGEEGQFPFPLPSKISVTFVLNETVDGSGPPNLLVKRTYGVAEHVSPSGGYRLPFKQADLPAGAYWSHGRHGSNNSQRWAYDLGVERWAGSFWSPLRVGGSFANAADFLTWDRPLYAVADGEIIGCNRGANDNLRTVHEGGPPASGNVPGGNVLWIRSGNETTLYAHLKKDSIPFELCPFTDDAEHRLADPSADPPSDAQFRVRVGQLIGRVGNSGNSTSHTHLHIHVFRGLPRIAGGSEGGIDADGRPLQFVGARVQPADPTNVSPSLWNTLEVPAQLPYFSRISDAP